jgi:Ser/Thr protein kinase RdoA (MazF antagonist)
MKRDIKTVAAAFDVAGTYVSGAPYGSGHINDTYAITLTLPDGPRRYILQRINHDVFKNPVQVVENIERVTQHLRGKLKAAGADDTDRRTLTLIPTRDGSFYHVDADGNHWRMYIFIEGARTYDELETTNQAYEAAKAFGTFMKQLADLPGDPLVETIPGFHDTRARFDAMQAAINADICDRATSVANEIAFANEREDMVDTLLELQRAGTIPLVTTHNDTKLNNVMLDDTSGEGICVIDLDTVMPGLSLYDFGDMVRTAMRPCPEDETDLSKVVGRIDMFEAITQGYLAAAGDALSAAEIEHLAFSARLITFEIGIRFLTDYLEGDTYFKTRREGHNRDRTRVQFGMVASMEQQSDAMEQIVRQTAPQH